MQKKTPINKENVDEVVDSFQITRGAQHATAGRGTYSFVDIDTNINARDGFTRGHYEYFRPEEQIAKKSVDIIMQCMNAYRTVGPIRQTIDLMSDFAAKGIKITSTNPREKKIYETWFNKVKGQERSERFANLLCRCGNVIVRKYTAKSKKSDAKKMAAASADFPKVNDDIGLDKNELPIQYVFLSPLSVDIIGTDIVNFINKPSLGIRLSNKVKSFVNKTNKTPEELKLMEQLPPDIVLAAKQNKNAYPLDPNKVDIYYYKKDDWEPWADPIIRPILPDVLMLNKLKLADLAVLDSPMSKIRVFKLGNLENKLYPTVNSVNKLANMLTNNVGKGSVDLIWGPDIEILETKDDSWQYLGPEKYKPSLNAIYEGLGIPPSLSASSSNAGGFTNNAISIRILMERIIYVRSILTEFWLNELKVVQRAFGLKAPKIKYDHVNLGDEVAYYNLLMQLVDRNLISRDTLLERVGEMPDIEIALLKREMRGTRSGRKVPKAGPWFSAQPEVDLRKIALQNGIVTPSEVGLELEERAPGQVPSAELKGVTDFKKPSGQPQQGRPTNSKDSTKRKQKRVLPRGAKAEDLSIWVSYAQKQIDSITKPMFLSHYEKKNWRSLTHEESSQAENAKFALLCSISPFEEITVESIAHKLANGVELPENASAELNDLVSRYVKLTNSQPSVDDIRNMTQIAYINLKGENNAEG